MKKIIRRVLIIFPAILLEIGWIYILLRWLAPWATLISTALSIAAFLFVLYIITKQDEGTYKILWLLVILTFPLAGAMLYLFFGNKRASKPLQKKLKSVSESGEQIEGSPAACEELAKRDPRMAQIFQYVQNTTGFPLHYNETARYYPLGDDVFPVMLAEMEQAKRFIFVEYFIVESGVMWDAMVEIMCKKVEQGVDVRVLYDDLGSITTYTRVEVRKLRKNGIQCVPFNPLFFVKGALNYRDHRKMLIVDNRVAFSGGINLADEYINQVVKYGHWKDIGIRLTGPAVQNYTRMFREFWNAFATDSISEDVFSTSSALPESQTKQGFVLSYYDSPLGSQAVSNELYIDLLSQAKQYAYFFTPYLLPGEALLAAFVRAARRGVDVRIMMPGVPDKKLIFRMSHSFYPTLLEAGVKIYEYIPGFVHAKGCVIDDKVGTVGTVNLDYRSLFLHFENNSLFYGADLLNDLKADYLATQEQCREMKIGENVRVDFWHWLLDGILRIFAPLC